MPTENLPADAILYLLGDLPVVVAPGKDPVALYNKTVSHGAEEAIELIERALTDAEKSQLFKLPQLSRDAFAKLTPPPWVEAQATQKELPRWVAWLRTKAANFKAKHTAKPQEAAKSEAKPAEPKPQHTEGEEDISGASDKDKHEASWKPKLSFRAVIAVAILGLFSVPFILQIPGCAKKKTGKATAVAAKSASKKADVEDDFMGGKPASKSAPKKAIEDDFMGGKPAAKTATAHAADSAPAGFVDGGKPTCSQTGTGIVWASNERTLPLTIRSEFAYIASLTSSQNTGYIFVNMRSGSVIVIGTKINLPLLSPEEILSKVPMPNALPAAVKASSVWRFADSDRGAATRAIELVCNTGSAVNPQRIIAQGGIMIWPKNTPTTSGCAFAIGLPNYKAFPCMTDIFARPHSPGESENRLNSEVLSIGAIAQRMVVKDMKLATKAAR